MTDSEVSTDGESECSTVEVANVDLAASYRPEGVFHLTETLTESQSAKPTKSRHFTPNIQALVLTTILFTVITLAQLVAAQIANSQALLMDCISMGVDALTYMGNIWVECRKRDGAPHEGSQIIVCVLSLSCLLYCTWSASQESLDTIQGCQGLAVSEEAPSDDVNGNITLAFGLGGVVFDVISLWSFRRSHRHLQAAKAASTPLISNPLMLHILVYD